MCTALALCTEHHYFGRTLDLEYRYNEEVVITPRLFPFRFRCAGTLSRHFALIGMATVENDYPLYYDAVNEKGLAMAALNFPQSASYPPPTDSRRQLAPFELIPYLLSRCETVGRAVELLREMPIAAIPFDDRFPLTPLHWMLSDRDRTVVIEPMADGLHIHENPVRVLTNEPPFPTQLLWLQNFAHVTREAPAEHFGNSLSFVPYSNGLGGMGLPGDLSSASRFVRAAFTALNAHSNADEEASVNRFFHILGAVTQVEGCVRVGDSFEKTVYTSCCDTDRGIYYYTTYGNRRISAVQLHAAAIDSPTLFRFPLTEGPQILHQN